MSEDEDRDLARRIGEAYRSPVHVDPRARSRLFEALRAERTPRRSWSWLDWLIRSSTTLHMTPLTGTAAVLALLLLGAAIGAGWSWRSSQRALGLEGPNVGGPPARMIEFVLVAPTASQVTLVGDFNGWDPNATPMRRASTGDAWSVAVPVSEGRHVYAFVVDGSRWVADPMAPLAPEDGFGERSSVLVVGGSES